FVSRKYKVRKNDGCNIEYSVLNFGRVDEFDVVYGQGQQDDLDWNDKDGARSNNDEEEKRDINIREPLRRSRRLMAMPVVNYDVSIHSESRDLWIEAAKEGWKSLEAFGTYHVITQSELQELLKDRKLAGGKIFSTRYVLDLKS